MAAPAPYYPPGTRPIVLATRAVTAWWLKLGHITYFCVRAIASIPQAVKNYGKETQRVLSDVTWGNGSIVVGGGTAGVILVLGAAGGAIVGIEGYNALQMLGMEPATGMVASTAATRELAPLMASLAFASQAGCRFTAQLGAMRIAEEIDALESIAIRPIPYLVSTRIFAAVIAVIPLYLVCLALNYLAVQAVVFLSGGLSNGTYQHYFQLVLSPVDVLYSLAKAVIFVIITSLIQCYYGFYASGGPQGVGTAAGRAMRAAISAMIVANLIATILFWGIDSAARLSG
ncbi:ABC transporter permease [Gordonia pseudamarae]|uniref:ABC transporter permease n=1 Tax=Gordonia pseudamarae TaxID=2831662 RepID=UPI001AF65E4C|nr:ABC transporter permease [Gordonia pseudamarae]QHN25368.1 ABC transporter permease [Gordonia pseudamarae]